MSSLVSPTQQYDGDVTITGSLLIDQDDLTLTNIIIPDGSDGHTTISASSADLADRWLYKDTAQTLPNLNDLTAATAKFDVLSLRKTLDSLDLTDDVLHVSPDLPESSAATITFANKETVIHKALTIDAAAKIGTNADQSKNADIADLTTHIYCPDSGVTRYEGAKTFSAKLASAYDVTVEDSFTTLTDDNVNRDFGSLAASGIVRRSIANTFTDKVTFDEVHVYGTLEVDNNIDATDEDLVLLNGRNVKAFEASIVKRSKQDADSAEINQHILTPITIAVSLPAERKATITASTGTVDDQNIFSYLDARVLLDESHPISVPLQSPKLTFDEGLTIAPSDSASTATTYFDGADLKAYLGTLYSFSDTSVSGVKTLQGKLTVGGNLGFAEDVHPFGIDLTALSSSGLQRSKVSCRICIRLNFLIFNFPGPDYQRGLHHQQH